jgi:cysteinyl-tRNA synthetase
MSMKSLGPSFDIHLGGEDLVFPHHEDEIAQSEGAGAQSPGEPFVKYWLHGAYLLVEGKKMSKSLGNFLTLRDLLQKGFTGREVRYLLLTAHYRESFNFTFDGLAGANASLVRIDRCLAELREIQSTEVNDLTDEGLLSAFSKAMDDDFNVAAAWGAIFDWIRDTNKKLSERAITPATATILLNTWDQINRVLGLETRQEKEISAVVEEALQVYLEERQAARKAKDFKRSDAIRDELKAKGWAIEDTPKGPRLKPLQK